MQNKRIAITGGIASGKSTVTMYLRGLGYQVIDADQITHDLYDHSQEFQDKIIETFGKDILSQGVIDRQKLGSIVFSDEKKRLDLNRITHPMIYDKILQAKSDEKFLFFDIPLYFEVEDNLKDRLKIDEVWLVYVDEKTQLERLQKRDGLSKKEALDRIQSQIPLNKKIELSDVILYNTKDMETLYNQIDEQLRDEVFDEFF